MRPDPTYKDIFAHPFMVEELMRWFVADLCNGRELVDALDFATLARAPEQSVSGSAGQLRTGSSDMVWRVRFRDRSDDDAWLLLILMLEFQSSVDFLMPLRIRQYVDNHHMEMWKGRRFSATDRLQPVLAIMLYTGDSPWSAAARVIDLVTPGASAETLLPDLTSQASLLFAGDGYLTLDSRRLTEDDFRDDNAAALLAAIEQMSIEHIGRRLFAIKRVLDGAEFKHLREVVLLWAKQTAERAWNMEVGDMAEIEQLQGRDEHETYFSAQVEAWKDGLRAEVRAEVRAEMRAERAGAKSARMRSPASAAGSGYWWRTDSATPRPNAIAGLASRFDDPAMLAEIGDWAIACESDEELSFHDWWCGRGKAVEDCGHGRAQGDPARLAFSHDPPARLGAPLPPLARRGEERQVQRVAVTETASSRGNQGGDLPATSTTPGS